MHADLVSDRRHELGECGGDSQRAWRFDGEFAVAAGQVL